MLKKLLKNNRGFTLIEVLVVIFIIGLLIAVLSPRLSQTNLNSKIDKVEADLRVFSSDINSYTIDYGGIYIQDCDTISKEELTTASKEMIKSLNSYLGFSLNLDPLSVNNGINSEGKTFCRVELETQLHQDPWGSKYRLLLDTKNSVIIVTSPGPNAVFTTSTYSAGDFGDDIMVIVSTK